MSVIPYDKIMVTFAGLFRLKYVKSKLGKENTLFICYHITTEQNTNRSIPYG